MRTFFVASMLAVVLAGGLAGGWYAMNYYNPGSIGTPAHAGAISNGRPEECTNVAINVKPRSYKEHTVVFQTGQLVRGTFEVNGGLGRVNIFLRVRSPQNEDILASPRAENYDFSFPVRSHGEYVFLLDNRFSMFTAKAVGLFYCVDSPSMGNPL